MKASFADIPLPFTLPALRRGTLKGRRLRVLALARPIARPAWPRPGTADALYAGVFDLAGVRQESHGRPIFGLQTDDAGWLAALHGFDWLATLVDGGGRLHLLMARRMIGDWVEAAARLPDIAHAPEVTARRVINWITLAPALLDGAAARFAELFHLALGQQVRRLLAFSTRRLAPTDRLRVLLALGYATTALQGLDHLRDQALAALTEELQRQILPDGGHVSRSPAVLLDTVAALIPLRAALTEARLEIPPRLNAALERAVPGLRFFLHGDGGLALFHGTSDPAAAVVQDTLAGVDGGGKTLLHAPHGGYARLERGIGVVIADVGAPPDRRLNADGAASTGAFEFSSGQQRIITNCGAPLSGDADWQAAARLTAAHSTACLGDADLAETGRATWRWWPFSSSTPARPQVEAEAARDVAGVSLRMQHDGWAGRFGHLHRRELFLSADGETLSGADLFILASGGGADVPFTARFHLHPDLKTAVARDGGSVMLALPDGSAWRFCAEGAALAVEESVWMAGRARPVRSRQIVLSGRTTPAGAAVRWQLRRLPTRPVTRKRARASELPELPL